MHTDAAAVAARYARFAREEAPGRSALYGDWAAGVAGDPRLCGILARIPETRRQPPLVFAVSRLLGAPEEGFAVWADWVSRHADELVAEASVRSLQTNEPQRCAALLPALCLIDGPIALVELGASAGLCLYPDRYSYRYGSLAVDPVDGVSPVVLECALSGEPALRMPQIVWRAGIDLTPLDAADAEDRAFLSALVWPGEGGRRERIDAALDIAAVDPPVMVAGDASDPAVLAGVIAQAPQDATLVVTTPGVLPHIPRAGRERLLAALAGIDGVWISIDPPGLHDVWRPPVAPDWGGFVLGVGGVPVAAVDPLGAFVEWRAGERGARA
ncbi:hypothetical protein JOD63_000648 [Microbacterium terrae]|uniref:DUF2332 domain-containing protein n=1 Tax=Microbacterium terrae TaxID=69369 RepID=A0A0M2H6E0_9MICO|nr:DUF2332 domain-containing protein [Microbacterium terrae]KJL42057.1 hypothetical protein RS81_01213 [Microbacterium terrae]MBP1076680.1 hypothetical protein [Microbacterium terrae]GLJ97508.1 hypothetical protein GCM10017594_07050 [Microbacterium terrae]